MAHVSSVRQQRGLWDIIDTLSFCYDSPMREYPEFSVQGKSDEKIQLKSQVMVARRKHQYGHYLGLSGRSYLPEIARRCRRGFCQGIVQQYIVSLILIHYCTFYGAGRFLLLCRVQRRHVTIRQPPPACDCEQNLSQAVRRHH